MKYEVILRYGTNESGFEYRITTVRRENGAIAERDKMVASTVENMTEHANGGRVVTGSLDTDPNAVAVALVLPNGSVYTKVVTYRPVVAVPVNDGLEDALLASVLALGAGSL